LGKEEYKAEKAMIDEKLSRLNQAFGVLKSEAAVMSVTKALDGTVMAR